MTGRQNFGQNSDQTQHGGRQVDKSRSYCKICDKKGHIGSLFTCPRFPEFIPRGRNAKKLPEFVCKLCLKAAGLYSPSDCDHRSFQDYHNYLCKKQNINFLLCDQCHIHEPAQDWVMRNFKPTQGKKLLWLMEEKIPNYDATVNDNDDDEWDQSHNDEDE